jgi:hypothetical protein
MLTRMAVILLVFVCTIGLFGCYYNDNPSNPLQPVSQVDKNWGRSFEAAKYNQTLNPDAEKNLAPVEGLDGPLAERVMEGYKKGVDQKKQSKSSRMGTITIQGQY